MELSLSELKASRVAVLGAGAWGGTLAWLLASAGKKVSLWGRNPGKIRALRDSGRLPDPLPVPIPADLRLTADLADAVSGARLIIVATSSQSMKAVAASLAAAGAADGTLVVSAAKGLSMETLERMSEVIESNLPGAVALALSGPNLAYEIRSGLPTAAVVACADLEMARAVQECLSVRTLRLYAADDIAGVELGGTLKNIIAIAAGASDGLDLGVNAKAALMTRGLAEMVRLSTRLGASPATLYGLSGMGDLIATCQGPLSRNYRFGKILAAGRDLSAALAEVGSCVEGVATTRAVCELSQKLAIDLPIARQVRSTLDGEVTPEESIMALMRRPLVTE